MPIMPSPLVALPFVGIKLAGYTAVATRLQRLFLRRPAVPGEGSRSTAGPLAVGLVRTAVGLFGGIAYVLGFEAAGLELSTVTFFVMLAPLRFIEWATVLWLLFDRTLRHPSFVVRGATEGTIASYALDIPALALWAVIPGIPVC